MSRFVYFNVETVIILFEFAQKHGIRNKNAAEMDFHPFHSM